VYPHQGIEGLLVLPADHSFFGDQDPGEEGLVHLLAELCSCSQVCVVTVFGPADCLRHDPLDLPQTRFGLRQRTLGSLHLARDPFLLGLQEIQRHGSGVVGVKQLGPLVIERSQPFGLAPLFGFSVGLPLGEFTDHCVRGLSQAFGSELHLPVVVLDLLLHQCERPVLKHAGGPLLMPTDAEVVHVVLAGLGATVGDAQL
jgi:hypothetical protein